MILHFLVHAGYLTSHVHASDVTKAVVSIPNHELQLHWLETIVQLTASGVDKPLFAEFTELISSSKLDSTKIRDCLAKMLMVCSSFDLVAENSYHMLLLGGWLLNLHRRDGCKVSSNQEAGHGRYDVLINFTRERLATLFEFKKSDSFSQLDADAKSGLKQA